MPELPEVETVRMGLERYLVGHKILRVKLNTPKVFTGEARNLLNAKVVAVRRFAKVLSIDLSNGFSIVIHIKLTGQLIYRGVNLKNPPELSKKIVAGIGGKHTHVIFNLDRDSNLYFNDVRKFGWIKLMKTEEVETSKFIGKLGPEPFKDLTLEKFKEILTKSKRPIKVVIMDQEKIGGIGNIYANDSLLLSKVHPKKAANSLIDKEVGRLYTNILKVLKRGLDSGGASELSFVHADGSDGNYQRFFVAYGKEGHICPVCKKEKIEKLTVGGRGTYICPNCQKL